MLQYKVTSEIVNSSTAERRDLLKVKNVFGTPITGTYTAGVDFGYLGKPYDTATGLYNYGYRDYNPTAAREFLRSKILGKRTDRFSTFTTVDPIRDGSNWFVYVNNDPVNYVDLWGLEDMTTSEAGIAFIKSYEKFSSTAYKPTSSSKSTIGYGHEIQAGETFDSLTEEEASALLKKDLKWVEDGINKNYEGEIPLTQQQFDAMVSLGINAGRSGLIRSDVFSNAEKGITEPDVILAGFRTKNTSNGEYLLGLDRRRYDEAEMYLYGDYNRDDDLELNSKCSLQNE